MAIHTVGRPVALLYLHRCIPEHCEIESFICQIIISFLSLCAASAPSSEKHHCNGSCQTIRRLQCRIAEIFFGCCRTVSEEFAVMDNPCYMHYLG